MDQESTELIIKPKKVYRYPPSPPGYSFWQLFSLYRSCPYSYKLVYEDRAQSDFSGRPRLVHLTFRGAVFHDVMDLKTINKYSWPETMGSIFGVVKEKLQEKVGIGVTRAIAATVVGEIRYAVSLMPDSPHVKVFDSITESELPIYSELEKGKIIKGRVDAVGELDIASFYLDWKAMDQVSGNASRQLAFYSLVRPVQKAFVYYPMVGVLKPARLSEKRLFLLKEEVLRLIRGIEERKFARIYSRCPYCFHWEVCRPRRGRPPSR